MQSSVLKPIPGVSDMPVVLIACFCHAIAGLSILALSSVFQSAGPTVWVVVEGTLAALFALLIGLPSWWFAINCLIGPLALWMQRFNIESGWFLGAFLLLALLFWTTFQSRVPLYLTNDSARRTLANLLPQGARFLDLGCGFGGLLLNLARNRPDGQYQGFEIAPLPALIASLRARSSENAKIERGDFWRAEFGNFDVVYAYLSPAPMEALWNKARSEMRPGSILISNSFVVPGVEPDEVIALHDYRDSALHIWRI